MEASVNLALQVKRAIEARLEHKVRWALEVTQETKVDKVTQVRKDYQVSQDLMENQVQPDRLGLLAKLDKFPL